MSETNAQARRYLDARIGRLRLVADEPRPRQGWIRGVRDALGMSSTELAVRMGTAQSTISGVENSEIRGTIKLGTLRRAAATLNCEVVYYLAPRTSLDEVVLGQARSKAREQLAKETPSSAGAGGADDSDRLEELALRYVDTKGLWAD